MHRFSAHPGELRLSVASSVKVGQIITFALAQGVIVIAAVMLYLALDRGGQPPPQDRGPGAVAEDLGGASSAEMLLPLIGISALAIAALAAVLVPGFIRQQAIDRFSREGQSLPMPLLAQTELTPAAAALVQAKMMSTLISQALLEGAAVINAIFLLLTSQPLFLLPVAIAVFGIVVQVPTTAKVLDWLESVSRS